MLEKIPLKNLPRYQSKVWNKKRNVVFFMSSGFKNSSIALLHHWKKNALGTIRFKKMLKRTIVCQLLSINIAHNSFSQLIEIRNNVILGSCEINYNGHLPFKTFKQIYIYLLNHFFPTKSDRSFELIFALQE